MESATYNFNCPHCGQQISGEPSHAGTEVNCPGCGQTFTVPSPARPVSAARNPLVIPLVAVSVLLVAALGAAGVLWTNRDHAATVSVAVPKSLVSPATETPPKSAEPTSFEAVAGHLDQGGSLYFYVDTVQWLAGLSKQMDSFRDVILSAAATGSQDAASRDMQNHGFGIFTDLVKNSGIEEISGVGASSIAVEPGIYVNKLFVHHGRGKDTGFLWSAFGKTPHPLEIIDLLPADTALASSTDLDLGNLLDGVRAELAHSGIPNAAQAMDASLAQFSTAFGIPLDDLLKSLGGSIGSILTLNPAKPVTFPVEGKPLSFPTPRLAILLQVKDDRLFNQIDRTLGAIPGIVRHDESDLRMRTMPMPMPGLEWFRPTVAQWAQRYLLIASDDTVVGDIMAARKTGQGLKATPQFASLVAGLPREGNAFQIVTPQFGETWGALQREVLKSQPGTTPEQMALMQKLFAAQSPGSVVSITTHLEDGWLVVGKGTQGASRMFGPLLIAPAAILAGAALPVFSKVQEKGKATKSMSNAKQLATACKLYAIDNKGKFPPTLQALVPDYLANKDIFPSPFRPEVPLGYEYTPGLTATSPPNTVLIEDKFAPEVAHERVVAHVDASAEVIRVPPVPAH